MFKKPSWWDRPITWGGYTKFAGWCVLASLIIGLVEMACFGMFNGGAKSTAVWLDNIKWSTLGMMDEAKEEFENLFKEKT